MPWKCTEKTEEEGREGGTSDKKNERKGEKRGGIEESGKWNDKTSIDALSSLKDKLEEEPT